MAVKLIEVGLIFLVLSIVIAMLLTVGGQSEEGKRR